MEFINQIGNTVIIIYLTGFACFLIGFRLRGKRYKKELDETRNLLEERKKEVKSLERQIANVQRVTDNYRDQVHVLEHQERLWRKKFKELEEKDKVSPQKQQSGPGKTIFDHLTDV